MNIIDTEGIPVAPLSMAQIERKTEQYLMAFHPEFLKEACALDTDKFLEISMFKSHSFKLDLITSFENPLIEAQALMLERKIQITQECYNRLGANEGHARFTAAHEGAHVILQSSQYQFLALNPARLVRKQHKTYENAEWQAYHGAGAILMPLQTLIPLLDELSGQNLLYKTIVLEEVFNVSIKAAESRLKQLVKPSMSQIISEYSQNLRYFDLERLQFDISTIQKEEKMYWKE
jgi:hypothetical protein